MSIFRANCYFQGKLFPPPQENAFPYAYESQRVILTISLSVKNFKFDNSYNPAPVKIENFTLASGPVFVKNSDSYSGKNPRPLPESTAAHRLRDPGRSQEFCSGGASH